MRVKWSERPRNHRWAIIGAFLGIVPATVAVFEFAYHGTFFDRYLILATGFLLGGGAGLLLASVTGAKDKTGA